MKKHMYLSRKKEELGDIVIQIPGHGEVRTKKLVFAYEEGDSSLLFGCVGLQSIRELEIYGNVIEDGLRTTVEEISEKYPEEVLRYIAEMLKNFKDEE